MDTEKEKLSTEKIRALLPECLKSLPIVIYDSTDSTNTRAKALALEGAEHGTAVCAESQTAGRGRQGKSFFSPGGTGLYMSLVLRPGDASGRDVQMATVLAAVAVCRAIEAEAGVSPKIKWVNDLYLGGRKVCGILAEAVASAGGIDSVILGVGVNCTTESFPGELQGIAGSLGNEGLSRNALAAKIVGNILSLWERAASPEIMEEYRARSLMQGKTVSYMREGAWRTGVVTDINNEGNLAVSEGGVIRVLRSGEVSVKGDFS